MKPSPEADKVYLAHMLECTGRIDEYVGGDEALGIKVFRRSPLAARTLA